MESKKVSEKLLLKSAFWYTSSNFLTKAIAFITIPVFTRILSKAQYGDFTVFASWQVLLTIICGIEAYGTINKARFDYAKKEDLDSYIFSSITLGMLFTALIFTAYVVLPKTFYNIFLLDSKYILVMFAYLFTYPVFSMFQAKQRIEYKYKLSSIISFSVGVFSSILSIVLTLAMKNDQLLGRIFGQYILYIVVGVLFFIYFMKCSHRITFSSWKYALSLGIPLVFSALGGQIFIISNNLLVKHMCSAEEVSYVAITVSCSNIILLLLQAINSAWAPWLYDMLKMGKEKSIKRAFQIYLWIVIMITCGVILIGPEIITVLGGDSYKEAMYILPASVLCGVFSALTSQFVNLEIYYGIQKYTTFFTLIVAIFNIVVGAVGVKILGYQAVCYATVLSQLILVVMHYCLLRKREIHRLFEIKNLIVSLLISLSLIPIAQLLYHISIIRVICCIVIFIIIVVVMILKKNDLWSLVKKIGERE